jgi:hypothetical protein
LPPIKPAWFIGGQRRPHTSPKRKRGEPDPSLALRANVSSAVAYRTVTIRAPILNQAIEPATIIT